MAAGVENVSAAAELRPGVPRGWSCIWWALCAASGISMLMPVFAGRGGLLVAAGVFSAGALARQRALRSLSRKESAFAFVVLLCFAGAQTVQREWADGPAAANRGFDFSAYYLAARAGPARLPGGLYQLPLYPDGRVNLNIQAPSGSGWDKAAKQWGVPFAAPFIYPPLFAVVARPLGALSFEHAFGLWRGLMLACTLGGAALAWMAGQGCVRPYLLPLAGAALFSYYPLLEGVLLGQSDSLVFLLLAACMYLLRKDCTMLSAFCFAAAALVKLTPLLALPVLIMHRRWRWLGACAGSMAALSAFSIWGAGLEEHRRFFHDVLPRLGCGAPIVSNTSIVAWVQELCLGRVFLWQQAPTVIPAYACVASRAAALAVYAGVLALLYRKRNSLLHDFSLVVLLTLVVSPISWWHHATVALLPCLYLWSAAPAKPHRLLLVLFTVLATNCAGFALLLTSKPVLQLTLAAVVPGLMLAVIATSREEQISACVPGGAPQQ